MKTYLHDGSFEGLLTSLYEAFYSKEKPYGICCEGDYVPNLLTVPVAVITNMEKAGKVSFAIEEKISTEALKKINMVFLSDSVDAGHFIYHYLKLGFKVGDKVDCYLNHDVVMSMNSLESKVKLESHRMKGFIRFRKIGDFFYARFEPVHNVLPLIWEHFTKRLPAESFILHDIRRGIAFFYHKGDHYMAPFAKDETRIFLESGNDCLYEELWREFYKSITVEGRENKRQQKSYMPVRYWKHLTEMK